MIFKNLSVVTLAFFIATGAYAENFFLPFMQKVVDPITIDGNLDEWNFCFTFDANQSTILDNSRTYSYMPDDDIDISGKVMFMWDENHLYMAAIVRDDLPGVLPQPPDWSADAVEIYIGNYHVGFVPWDQSGYTTIPDENNGDFACQLVVYYDGDADTCRIHQYSPVAGTIHSEFSAAAGVLWENYEGYNLEAKIAWDDIQSNNGNTFDLLPGDIIPFTIQLYDRDEYDEDDFQMYSFSEEGSPAWQNPGKGWQVIEVRGERESGYYKDASPYLKMAKEPVQVDGYLDEWNFCFPVSMNQTSVPEYSRAITNGWFPEDNIDLSSNLMFMYDEDYLYFGASVMDDVPGVIPERGYWSADAVEIYIGNYDIGAMGTIPAHGGLKNSGDSLDMQMSFYADEDPAQSHIKLWQPGTASVWDLEAMDSAIASTLWETGEGYNIEGRISLADLAEQVDEAKQRTFDFAGNIGAVFPCTYSLYDRDEWDTDDFNCYQYVNDAAAPWQGPGAGGWEGVEIVPKSLYDVLGELWTTYTDVAKDEPGVAVTDYSLSQNYPNPFNPITTIEFSLNRSGHVSLSVFNILGEQVATVVNGTLSPGVHRVQFDAASLTGGFYFYKLETAGYSEVKRMVLLK